MDKSKLTDYEDMNHTWLKIPKFKLRSTINYKVFQPENLT